MADDEALAKLEVLKAVPREQMAKVAEPHGEATRSLLQQIKLHAMP